VWLANRAEAVRPGPAEAGPTITATLRDGPVAGRSIETPVVEGRPPKIIDVPVEDGTGCRYCLADWMQSGPTAIYAFVCRIGPGRGEQDGGRPSEAPRRS
jgi:hypothetical protein